MRWGSGRRGGLEGGGRGSCAGRRALGGKGGSVGVPWLGWVFLGGLWDGRSWMEDESSTAFWKFTTTTATSANSKPAVSAVLARL